MIQSKTQKSEDFGNNLKEILRKKEMKQVELAKHLNITPTTFSNYITGKSSPPLDLVKEIASYLDCTISQLFGERKYCQNTREEEYILTLYDLLNKTGKNLFLQLLDSIAHDPRNLQQNKINKINIALARLNKETKEMYK